jgi:EmrB/QacA subfamily drug resistance transporter
MEGSTTLIDAKDRLAIVVGVLTAMLLAALDQTIVAPALPTIGAALGHTEYLSWVVTAYLVTATAVTPLYGKWADIQGRRTVIFVSMGIFVAGSIGCALAPNLFVLIFARAFQGIGGGGLMALAITVIGDVVAPRERGQYMGYISGVWAISSIAGPTVGGLLTQHVHWSMIFWLNLPLAAIAFGVMNAPLKKIPIRRRNHRLDWVGACLVIAATVCFLMLLNWGGSRFPWLSWPILSLAALVIFFTVWLIFHLQSAPEPLLPPDVLKNPIVAWATLSVFFAMASYIGLYVYLPIYFEGVRDLGAGLAGVSLIPLIGAIVVGAATSGRVSSRVTHYKRMAVGGLVLGIVGLILLCFLAQRASFLGFEVMLLLTGFGVGTLFPIITVSVQNAVDPSNLGIATAALTFLRSLGGAIGVAVVGMVFLANGMLIEGGAGASTANFTAADVPRLSVIFTIVFAIAALALLISTICLLCMEEKPLRSGHQPQIDAAERETILG